MPRIPEFVPRVRPETPQSPGLAAPGVAPVRDATGQQMAALGEGLQAAGVAADRLGDWIDETQAQSVYNLFDEELSKIESSYGQLQGKDAMDAYQKTMESVGAARKKFEGSLQNERQRMMFASRAQVRQGDGEVRLGAWGAKQTKAAKVGSLEAGSAGSFRNYQNTLVDARESVDPASRRVLEEKAKSWLDTGLRQREEAMRLLGSTDEQVAEMRATSLNDAHGAVLTGLLKSDDTKGAQSYFAANEKEITGELRQNMERQIKLSGDRDLAWNLANSKDLPTDFMGRVDAINQLRADEKITTEQWQQAISFASQQQDLLVKGRRQMEVDLLTAAEKHYSATPGEPLPTDLQIRAQDLGLLDDVRARRDNARSTDAGRQVLFDLTTDSSPLKDEDWNAVVLRYGRYLGAEDRDTTLRKLWESANGIRGSRGASSGASGAGSSESVYTSAEETMHLYRLWAGDEAVSVRDSAGKPKVDWFAYDNFQSMWTRQLREAEMSGGKALSVPEKEELIAKLKLRNKGLRGDEEVNFLNLTAEQQLGFRFSQETGVRGAELREVVAKPEEFNQFNASASMVTASARLALQKHDEGRPTDEKLGRYNARGELDYAATGYLPFLRAMDWARTTSAAEAKSRAISLEVSAIRASEAAAKSVQQRDRAVRMLAEKGVPPGSDAWVFATNGVGAHPGESFDDTLRRLIERATRPAPYDAANLTTEQKLGAVLKEDAELIQRVETEVARLTALAADDPSWQSDLDDYKRSKAYARYQKVRTR